MGATAVIAAAAGAQYKSSQRQEIASRRQRSAQRRANEIERRRSDISNQRSRRQYASQLAALQASNIASSFAGGSDVISSSILGANIGAQSDLGSSIGYQNTILAANIARANALQQGADRAAGQLASANNWGAIASTAGTVSSYAMPR